MKVFYLGNYREPSVNYRGEVFESGKATDVTDEWFALNCGPNIVEAESTPIVVTDAPFIEAPKRRGRPPKVSDDNSN